MSGTELLCLNRIIKPQIPLEEFLKFTADLGIKYVEVRNDFTDKGVLDGLSDAALQGAFKGSLLGPQRADRKTQGLNQADHLGFSKQRTIGG